MDEQTNTLHVYANERPHDELVIVGDQEALKRLRNAIDAVLEQDDQGDRAFETRASDGAPVSVRVVAVQKGMSDILIRRKTERSDDGSSALMDELAKAAGKLRRIDAGATASRPWRGLWERVRDRTAEVMDEMAMPPEPHTKGEDAMARWLWLAMTASAFVRALDAIATLAPDLGDDDRMEERFWRWLAIMTWQGGSFFHPLTAPCGMMRPGLVEGEVAATCLNGCCLQRWDDLPGSVRSLERILADTFSGRAMPDKAGVEGTPWPHAEP